MIDVKQELELILGLMEGNVGYYLRKNGYRGTKRNRLVAALYLVRHKMDSVAALRYVDWYPISDLLEEAL